MKGSRSYLFVVIVVFTLLAAACALAPPTETPVPEQTATPKPTVEVIRPRPPNSVPLIVAAVTMKPAADKAANLKEFERYMKDAAGQGAQLVVFPEIALQQNPGWGNLSHKPTAAELAYVKDTAEPIPGESTAWLTAKAKEVRIYVIFGMTEAGDDGKLYNTSVFLGPEGVLGRYRKRDLWDATLYRVEGNEHKFWSRGADKGTIIDSPLGRIGMMICIEMYYGYGMVLGAEGVDLMVTVSAWPSDGGVWYEKSAMETADMCKCWHVVSNQVGKGSHVQDYGNSMIIDPTGKVVASAADVGMAIAQTGLWIDAGTLAAKRP